MRPQLGPVALLAQLLDQLAPVRQSGVASEDVPDDTLIPLVNATIRLTMPEGIEPFFARLTGLMGAAGMAEAPAPAPAGKRIRKAA